jgi:hypothetical protein
MALGRLSHRDGVVANGSAGDQSAMIVNATIFKAELEENFPIALYLGEKAPALPLPAPVTDGLAYNVFLSYRQQELDKTWVRKILRPRLEAEGLRVCIDRGDFHLGAPRVTEMARAVEQSRYTLAVLFPRYLTSNFTEVGNVLAEHLGLEQSQLRLLAVMCEDCKLRLGMPATYLCIVSERQHIMILKT